MAILNAQKVQLELVAVPDEFQELGVPGAALAMFQVPTYRVSMMVANVTVLVQWWMVPPHSQVQAGAWKEPAEFTIPGAGSITRPFLIGGVRFKNQIPANGDVNLTAVVCARAG